VLLQPCPLLLQAVLLPLQPHLLLLQVVLLRKVVQQCLSRARLRLLRQREVRLAVREAARVLPRPPSGWPTHWHRRAAALAAAAAAAAALLPPLVRPRRLPLPPAVRADADLVAEGHAVLRVLPPLLLHPLGHHLRRGSAVHMRVPKAKPGWGRRKIRRKVRG
jgi:hypothetical protein